MEVEHTLDLGRLQVLDTIQENIKGSAQALSAKVQNLSKKRIDKNTQLNAAKAAARGVASGGISEHRVEGGAGIVSKWTDHSSAIASWRDKAAALEREVDDLDRQINDANVEAVAEWERFNAASHLHEECKRFVAERQAAAKAQAAQRLEMRMSAGGHS